MKIVILGGTGMLGYQMVKQCIKRNLDFYTVLRNPNTLPAAIRKIYHDRIRILDDASNWNQLENCLSDIQPDYLINCIGIVKQSYLADAHIDSISINSLLPHKLEYYGQKLGYKLIHISTDCVFKGDRGNYTEDDISDATDLYGRSKYLGEVDYGCGITIRTSIIGHEISKPHHGLLEWFLSQKNYVHGYSKAIFSGLTTNELVKVILDIIIPREVESGLYHIAAEPISKFKLLKLIGKVYGKELKIESSDKIKIDRSLDGSKFVKLTGYKAPNWKKMIEDMKNA